MIKLDVNMISCVLYTCAILHNIMLDTKDLILDTSIEVLHTSDKEGQMLQASRRVVSDEALLIQIPIAQHLEVVLAHRFAFNFS